MTVCFQVAFMFALFFSRCAAIGAVFNFSLDPQSLEQANYHLEVLPQATLHVYCTPDQDSIYLYNLPEGHVDDCLIDDTNLKVIGSCQNSPLQIAVVPLKLEFLNLVSYVLGQTYYFGGYNYANGGIIDNNPCLNGIKFSLTVVESLKEEVVSSSPVVMAPSPSPSQTFMETPSPSLVISTGSFDSSSIAMVTPTTISSSQGLPTTSRPITPRPTTPPTDTPTRPTTTRPTLNDPLADGIANHAHVNQSLAFLSLLLATFTLLLLLS